ncbi:C-myc promoter-binding protein [Plakobranchus ocellatus]|uniref:C-myc promoter-binding protein n=1 Tax=Plakobranchus ocellatus TaxID=259542 RepID=A0AAV4E1B6_9GAST|nr:C-myc promoter-binding protein [Plakobranchus ocellatus]
MEDRRVADYFVVAGLDPNQQLPLEEFSNEANAKSGRLDPITDITVINRSLGEKIPTGYECLEQTPSGYPANLNHGSLRCPDMFICYKRGRDKPPLKDLGILYEGKERVMEGCEVVHTTQKGNPANINNSSSSRIYITYRRAEKSAPSDTLVVVDICIILGNRGEEPPLTFLKIGKNLNKGMLGSDVFLCYKKAMVKHDVLAYKASILDRYPLEDYEDFPLPESVSMFCLPMGATIECWSADAQHPSPNFSTFILTGAAGGKVYGAAVGFYEEYKEEDLTDEQMRSLGLKNKSIREQYHIKKTVHVRKSISLLSHWPFFDAFKKFLSQLYKISITSSHNVPIERHISHFMYVVPYPSPERPRILVELTKESLSLCMPEDSPFPQSGASFITLLRNLGPELAMNLLLFVLLESKILLHSLRPTVLTEVAEAVSTMIFPFQWQCPYIPLCPLGLSDVLNAPCPFIVGVDSRYFDLYDPPSDVICVDLDTNRIYLPEDKKSMNYKLLPKRPSRVMQESLSKLYDKVSQPTAQKRDSEEVSLENAHHDAEFRKKKQDMQVELCIQEIFLRFTASIFKDYKNHLNPITTRVTSRATGASSLFDMQAFIKTRDKANAKFYAQVMQTQMFFKFIEERSFVSDKDDSLAFFDECTEKVDEMRDEPKLIEMDNKQTSERTVFIMPPEPVDLPEGVKYHYNGFPSLKAELFLATKKASVQTPAKQICPNSPHARRSKQEVKTAQKIALQQAEHPETWAKCLLSYCYSLWFVAFPAYVQFHPKKYEALKVGFAVLKKMQGEDLITIDELCYRVLMQLAGQYNKPGLAVQVFSEMKRQGVHPNAITYGYYNKVMLEAKWPSRQSRAHLRWMKIRNVVIAVAQFRKTVRRRSLSLYSNSGSELDKISHASVDSCMCDAQSSTSAATAVTNTGVSRGNSFTKSGSNGQQIALKVANSESTNMPSSASTPVVIENLASGATESLLNKNNGSLEERMSTGGVSDRGYNSLTQEDVKRMSQMVMSAATDDNGSVSSPTTSENSDKASKSRSDTWNPLNLNFLGLSSIHKSLHAEKLKKDVHIDDGDKPALHVHKRGGSIVKRLNSVKSNHVDDYDVLKGSLLNNSCGLVILSQLYLEHSAQLPETDLRMQVEEAKRRRHRSSGEAQTRPSRSFSLFASWRPPRHNNGLHSSGEGFSKLRFLDSVRNERLEPGSFSSSSPSCATQHLSTLTENANVSNSDFSIDPVECAKAKSTSSSDSSSTPSQTFQQLDISNSSLPPSIESCNLHCSGVPLVTINESEVSSHDIPKSAICATALTVLNNSGESSTDDPLNENPSSPERQQPSEAGSDPQENIDSTATVTTRISTDPPTVSRNDIRRSVSVTEDKLSGQVNEAVVRQPSLAATGRTHSSPGTDLAMETKASMRKKSEDTQSVSSLTTESKREKPVDFIMKRSQSLKKTNEVFGSFLKASKAAFNKLSELSQTITTPIKNGSLGSLGSLTHSVEELDTNDGSSTSGTIRERLKHGGSQDLLSHSEESEEDINNRLSKTSFESVPSPSYLEDISCLKSSADADIGLAENSECDKIKVAMEVAMSTCSRCTKCNRLIYDEEIMAGWSAEDSNLNTRCPYCHAKFVPSLQVYLKDYRGDSNPVVFNAEQGFPVKEKLLATSGHQDGDSDTVHSADSPMSCGESTTDPTTDPTTAPSSCLAAVDLSPTAHHPLAPSPPPTSSPEECLHNGMGTLCGDSKCAAASEPVVVPYLSPLVLRKEVEYVLDHEGNTCLASDSFVEEHPIIFWNMIWFFRRIEVPSHFVNFLLSSKAFFCNKTENAEKCKGLYTNRNILIRPQWDNIRIHDEIGLPMYLLWRARNTSPVVDALNIDNSYKIMCDIKKAIESNDIMTAIKLIAGMRRGSSDRQRRFRSMYREILFLSFAACGRHNIDHDAFDREYAMAFEEKLHPVEVRRFQLDDHPKGINVQFCRQVFCELEL